MRVVAGRLGFWPPGLQRFQGNDVSLLFGSNLLVSIAHLDTRNPLKRLKKGAASLRRSTNTAGDYLVSYWVTHLNAEHSRFIVKIGCRSKWT